MSAVLDQICAYAERTLAGSNLTFALVVWVKGEQSNPASVAISTPPAMQKHAPTALRTTAAAADPEGEPKALTAEELGELLTVLEGEREVVASSHCMAIEPGAEGWDLDTIDEPTIRPLIDQMDRCIAALKRVGAGAEAR